MVTGGGGGADSRSGVLARRQAHDPAVCMQLATCSGQALAMWQLQLLQQQQECIADSNDSNLLWTSDGTASLFLPCSPPHQQHPPSLT